MVEKSLHHLSLIELGRSIEDGSVDPCDLVEYYLSRIEADQGKDTIFIQLFAEETRRGAEAARARARTHTRLSLYDGIPLAWKDNFDIAGKPTSSGIPALAKHVAHKDAVTYRLADQAGFICIGKTNMTELAFSGIGINPSYGTPRNPFDDTVARVPGGSSCGSAVAVAKGLCPAALGTDTGGSIRIPAAWNSLVGLKPTTGLISTVGVVPLCQTMDTVGFLTKTVTDAAVLLGVFTKQSLAQFSGESNRPNILLATNLVWEDIHAEIRSALETALRLIEQSGALVTRAVVPAFDDVIDMVNTKGNIVHYEGFKNWGTYLNANPHIISPDILAVFNMGAKISDHDIQQVYAGLHNLKMNFIEQMNTYDTVLMPTVVHIPPVIAALEADTALYAEENALALRNTRLANLLGLCAISIPVGSTANGFPVGLMLVGVPHSEKKLLRTATALEMLFRQHHDGRYQL